MGGEYSLLPSVVFTKADKLRTKRTNGTDYYYASNIQGDVTAILNTSGTAVVKYTYDAWGRPLTTSGTMSNTLGIHNPLRYRGYVYDDETNLYYLQSRYYDSEIGRFINADNYPSTGQGLTGNNMFAYCLNNPILMQDAGGESATIAGAIVGGVFGLINGIIGGGSPEQVLKCTVTGMLTGAAAGFIADVSVATCGIAGAIIGSAIGGGLMGAANSAATQSILNDGRIDRKKVIFDGVIGAAMGGFCTAMGDIGKPVVSGLREGIQYVCALVSAEEIMIAAHPIVYTATALAFDIGASAVTGFGSWMYGLAYDYYSSQMSNRTVSIQ